MTVFDVPAFDVTAFDVTAFDVTVFFPLKHFYNVTCECYEWEIN